MDFFIDHGDTIYAENYSDPSQPTAATLPEHRAKYAESMATRLGLNTRRDLHGSTAILATIDDHEVTNDFAGGAPPARIRASTTAGRTSTKRSVTATACRHSIRS